MSEHGSTTSNSSGKKRRFDGRSHAVEADICWGGGGRDSDDMDTMSVASGRLSRSTHCSSDSGDSKKQNHSEIEKRRRDKMNCYINELAQLLPMCQTRKLDKLTVLRMTVQHMRSLRTSAPSPMEAQLRPAFVSELDMKKLLLQSADGFVFVVSCDRGRVLYVSKSVQDVLEFSQDELIGQSLFDILHPHDISKVKEQLATSDLTARNQLIDSKTLLPIPGDVPDSGSGASLCPGSTRSFFCRMKVGQTSSSSSGGGAGEQMESCGQRRQRRLSASADKRFRIVHCAGYLKAWVPSTSDVAADAEDDNCSLSCLVAIGRLVSRMAAAPETGGAAEAVQCPRQFFSRHATDGKFLYADPRVTTTLGYLPHELVGTSVYELCHPDDIVRIAESHRHCLQSSGPDTLVYKLRLKNNCFVRVHTRWSAFKNPWTKELEYISACNQVIGGGSGRGGSAGSAAGLGYGASSPFSPLRLDELTSDSASSADSVQKFDGVSASKIGLQIADEALDGLKHRGGGGGGAPLGSAAASPASSVETLLVNMRENGSAGSAMFGGSELLHTGEQLLAGAAGGRAGGAAAALGKNGVTAPAPGADADAGTAAQEDEAAMAVIMSLLEADAGLGGPVDFTGLPWPLP